MGEPQDSMACPVTELLAETGWDRRLRRDAGVRERMRASRIRLERLASEHPVYGVTRGFGPLVEHDADEDPIRQGVGLIHHLCTGQGAALPPDVVRTMIWLRLHGMTRGYSAVDPETWAALAEQWNHGFTPVVPQDGSLSASGDLIPLAHAALATTGVGQVWRYVEKSWRRESSSDFLRRSGLPTISWDARSALAFVNGTSAALARTLHNHARLMALARASAAATGRLVTLLGCNADPYADVLSAVRGHAGQCRAAALIRAELSPSGTMSPDRPLQESYSLRCAPQVIGAVLDQLRLQAELLVTEAEGCTDNPVLVDDRLLHGGNFHAAPVGLVSEQYASCVHQLAFLAERQLALTLDPRRNGGLAPLLAANPGRQSGLAGVQIAATAHLGAIRQRGYPASLTAVPTNLDNQDHVPLALNSANSVAEMLDRAWWVMASLVLAINQLHKIRRLEPGTGVWAHLAETVPVVETDRPLAAEVAHIATTIESHYGRGARILRKDDRSGLRSLTE